MSHILHIDASARPGIAGIDKHGSHSRNLTRQFVRQWRSRRAQDTVTYRDLGLNPPSFIDREWIQSAFTPASKQEPWMAEVLAESNALTNELIAADILVIGAPLYNFGMPAALKAWIDQVVRIDRTVSFNPATPEDPFTPLLADRPRHAVILSARGGAGFGPDGALQHMNHLEPSLSTVLEFIGISRIHCIALENEEAGGMLLANSIAEAHRKVDALVDELLVSVDAATAAEPA